jgi:putative ABC transport system permease protein
LAVRDSRAQWLRSLLVVALVALPVTAVTWITLSSWSRAAVEAVADPMADPVTSGPIPDGLVLGTAIGFVQIVLLAGAAFAVSARRRRRELALLAAAGAEPGDLTRAVLAQAGVLGGAGAALGFAVPWLLLSLGRPVVEAVTGWQLSPIPPMGRAVLLVPILGVLACLVASLPAARQVAAIPLAESLRSRDGSPADGAALRRGIRGWAGAVAGLLLVGFGVWEIGGYVAAANGSPGGALLGGSVLSMGVGVVLAQVGVVLLSPALLGMVTELPRLPLSGRLAARDAARNGLRSAFAVAAVAAATCLAAAALVWAGSVQQAAEAGRVPALPEGVLLIGADDPAVDGGDPIDAGSWQALTQADRAAVASGFPGARVALVGLASLLDPASPGGLLPRSWCDPRSDLGATAELLMRDPDSRPAAAARLPDDSPCLAPAPAGTFLSVMGTVGAPWGPAPGVLVVAPEDADLLIGRDDPQVRAALESGTAVALSRRAVHEGRVRLVQTQSWAGLPDEELPLADLPAVVVEAPVHPGAVLVSPATLADAGLRTSSNALVVSGDPDEGSLPAGFHVRYQQSGRLGMAETSQLGPFLRLDLPRAPRDLAGLWGALGFAVIATLLVTALALSEARGQLAVMAAVGAAPRIRRTFAACSAGIVGLLGAILGVAGGIPLGWAGLSALTWATDPGRCLWLPHDEMQLDMVACSVPVAVPLAVPWGWMLGLVLLLPAVAAVVQYTVTTSKVRVPRR